MAAFTVSIQSVYTECCSHRYQIYFLFKPLDVLNMMKLFWVFWALYVYNVVKLEVGLFAFLYGNKTFTGFLFSTERFLMLAHDTGAEC